MSANTFERGREYILWDVECGFCRRSVEKMASLDERQTFIFAPYQSFSEAELKQVGLDFRRCARELQVVSTSGKTYGGAFGINYFLWRQSRWKWVVALGFCFPLLLLLEVLMYKIVAGNRMVFSRIFFPKKN